MSLYLSFGALRRRYGVVVCACVCVACVCVSVVNEGERERAREKNKPPDPINHVCSLTGRQFSKKIILLIVQYKHLKSCPEIFILQNLILRTRSCGTGCITQSSWVFHFHLTTLVSWECFVPQLYQFRRGISGGPALKYFYMIHRGGRREREREKQSVCVCVRPRVSACCDIHVLWLLVSMCVRLCVCVCVCACVRVCAHYKLCHNYE